MPTGEAQEGRKKPGRGLRSWFLLDIKKGISHYTIFTQHGRENFAGQEIPLPLSRKIFPSVHPSKHNISG